MQPGLCNEASDSAVRAELPDVQLLLQGDTQCFSDGAEMLTTLILTEHSKVPYGLPS